MHAQGHTHHFFPTRKSHSVKRKEYSMRMILFTLWTLLLSTAIHIAPATAAKQTYPCVESECYFTATQDRCLCSVRTSPDTMHNYEIYKSNPRGSCYYSNLCTQGMKCCGKPADCEDPDRTVDSLGDTCKPPIDLGPALVDIPKMP